MPLHFDLIVSLAFVGIVRDVFALFPSAFVVVLAPVVNGDEFSLRRSKIPLAGNFPFVSRLTVGWSKRLYDVGAGSSKVGKQTPGAFVDPCNLVASPRT